MPASNLSLAMVLRKGTNSLQLTGSAPILPKTRDSEYKMFQEFLSNTSPNTSWCWPVIEGWGAVELHARALSLGTTVAVTDGSFKDLMATAAWVLQTTLASDVPWLCGCTLSPGAPDDQCPF